MLNATKSTFCILVLLVLATVSGCAKDGAPIDEDGVYFGELTAANPKRDDGSSYSRHAIHLEAGQELDVTLQSADYDAYLLVEDANGSLIGEDDDSAGGNNANLMIIAPTSGTYSIIASSYDSREYGEYILAIRRNKPDDTAIVFSGVLPEVGGKTLSTNLYPTHDIAASAGEVLDIYLTSGSFDTFLQVADSSGNILADDDDGAGGTNSRLTLPIRMDGVYTVTVKSFEDADNGPYNLIVRKEFDNAAADNENTERFNGRLSASNARLDDATPFARHVIDASAGEQLVISMSSDAFDSYLQLWTAEEIVIAEDDDSGGDLNSKLTYVVPTDGQYIIIANSIGDNATGTYEIQLRRSSLDAELASGNVEIITGTLSANHDVLADGTPMSSHNIEARTGERLDVLMTAGAFDAYLLIFDSQDKKLSEDDDSGGGTNARLSVIAPSDGTYRIVANSYTDGAEGPYSITLRRH